MTLLIPPPHRKSHPSVLRTRDCGHQDTPGLPCPTCGSSSLVFLPNGLRGLWQWRLPEASWWHQRLWRLSNCLSGNLLRTGVLFCDDRPITTEILHPSFVWTLLRPKLKFLCADLGSNFGPRERYVGRSSPSEMPGRLRGSFNIGLLVEATRCLKCYLVSARAQVITG